MNEAMPQTVKSNYKIELPQWRLDLYEELHARPFPFLQSPAQISQLACRNEVANRDQQIAHLEAWCDLFEQPYPEADVSCFYARVDDFELRWEMHTEFSTYTFIRCANETLPFEKTAVELLPESWLAEIAGDVVSAVHVSVMDMPQEQDSLDVLRKSFADQRLIGGRIGEDQAHVWTSFLSQQDGFSRFLIYNNELNKCEMGRLVQRLLEIETYRLFSLLTLPLSREALIQINAMDDSLCETVKSIPGFRKHSEEKALLDKLSKFSSEIESLRAKINYRTNATQAYAELVNRRLQELNEKRHPGLQSLGDFLERRFTPAIRTIHSTTIRLEDLSTRIDRATDLIRTKVDLELENRSQFLLSSLDDRSKRQFRLQRTVEGLSIVAISYYLVELIKMTLPGIKLLGFTFNVELIAVFTVPMILIIMLVVRAFFRRKFD